jgi:hypothetical protein
MSTERFVVVERTSGPPTGKGEMPEPQDAFSVVFVLRTVPVVAFTVALNSAPVPDADKLSEHVL